MRLGVLRFAICGMFAAAPGFRSDADRERCGAQVRCRIHQTVQGRICPGLRRPRRAARPVSIDPERIRINCMPLENIIMQAYIVYGNKQSGGPGPRRDNRTRLAETRLETRINQGSYGIYRDRSHRAAIRQLIRRDVVRASRPRHISSQSVFVRCGR